MKFTKKGLIYQCKNSNPELLSHASNPLPIYLKDNIYRVFFSGRDSINRSSVGYVDIDIMTYQVIDECTSPVFVFGSEDSFYSHGVSIGNVYRQGSEDYILFMGWNIRNNEHWRGDIGRLLLSNNSALSLTPSESFMTVDDEDKISLSYPFVLYHDGIYKMWYGSTIDWQSDNGEMIHVIKYATSLDGLEWVKHGVAIPYEIGVAQAFSRPSVMIDSRGYHMWYSYRSGDGTKYRIGYSYSNDGIHWERKHQDVGIDVSDSGWDSEMICYPFVFTHGGKTLMLYNGNEYGKYGFGLAVLE